MAVRTSEAMWEGDLPHGKGSIKLGSDAWQGAYSFSSRFEDGKGTNPEELIAAAHSGCFSMALAHTLAEAGFVPKSVHTTANVHLAKTAAGFAIPKIDLICEARIQGIDEARFQQLAKQAKEGCPVSKVLAGAEITLQATLVV